MENSHDGIITVDNCFSIVYCNQVFCRILNYSENEKIGTDFRDLLDDDSIQVVTERYLARQRGEVMPPVYEINARTKDGAIRNLEIKVTTYRAADKNFYTVTQYLDITDQKVIKDKAKNLEYQLYQAQKMEAVGQIAAYNLMVSANERSLSVKGSVERLKHMAPKISPSTINRTAIRCSTFSVGVPGTWRQSSDISELFKIRPVFSFIQWPVKLFSIVTVAAEIYESQPVSRLIKGVK